MSYLKADEQDESQIKKFGIGDLKSFFILFSFAKGYLPKYIMSLGLIFLGSLSVMISARSLGKLVEHIIAGDKDQAWVFAGMVLLFEAVAIAFAWSGRRFISKYSSFVILEIRKRLFNHLQNLPLSYFDRQPKGRIITRLTHDVEGIEDFFTGALGKLIQAIFMIILSIGAMIATDFKLGLILTLTMIPGLFFIFATKKMVRNASRRMSRNSSALNSKLSEFLDGMEVIRAFGLEKWSQNEYGESIQEYKTSMLGANSLFAWIRPVLTLLVYAPLVGLVWFGGHSVLEGTLAVGVFVSFMRYCERFAGPILGLAREIQVIQSAFTYTERVANFLKEPGEEVALGTDGMLEVPIKGEISFKNVYMSYNEGEPILKDVSFNIRPGEKIGLVGRTGSGKTTTISLLSRLYPFQSGDILLDGNSIKDFKRSYLREQIGLVSQDVIVFKGTLRDNLTDNIIGESVILDACEKTGLTHMMKRANLTLDSEILDGGANLSVGERQLLALTRIFIKNPQILVLDEATTNIDPFYEELIHGAVFKAMENKTCLIIAHRLDTLKRCDRILVFSDGRLIEEGHSNQLFENKGHFYSLHNAQGLS
ncbi:MAG: ABC transporter ATP-binding protein [Deltaproteobacteria bacterium]|nr:MAG: ABC transporter ATP-binding protein [Deltaproteobacteria bacterium]